MNHEPSVEAIKVCADMLADEGPSAIMRDRWALEDCAEIVLRCAVEKCGYRLPRVPMDPPNNSMYVIPVETVHELEQRAKVAEAALVEMTKERDYLQAHIDWIGDGQPGSGPRGYET